MRSFLAIVAIVLVGLVSSCGNDPYSAKIPINPKDWTESVELLNALEKLPREERGIIAGHFNSYRNTKFYSGPGTVGELLKELSERQRVSDAMNAENQETRDGMNRILNVELKSGKFHRSTSGGYYGNLDIAFQNAGNTKLVGLRGTLNIWDKFGRPILFSGKEFYGSSLATRLTDNTIELFLDFEIPHGETRIVDFLLASDESVPYESVDDILLRIKFSEFQTTGSSP